MLIEINYSNRKFSTDSPDEKAKQINPDMKPIKPALTDKLKSYLPIKLSLSLTIFVLIEN